MFLYSWILLASLLWGNYGISPTSSRLVHSLTSYLQETGQNKSFSFFFLISQEKSKILKAVLAVIRGVTVLGFLAEKGSYKAIKQAITYHQQVDASGNHTSLKPGGMKAYVVNVFTQCILHTMSTKIFKEEASEEMLPVVKGMVHYHCSALQFSYR